MGFREGGGKEWRGARSSVGEVREERPDLLVQLSDVSLGGGGVKVDHGGSKKKQNTTDTGFRALVLRDAH